MNFLASEWNFTMTNFTSVWSNLYHIGLLLIFLLIGNLIRNVIPFLKKSLIPSSLIGGLLLLLYNIGLSNIPGEGIEKFVINKQFMQVVTYHGLGIGFVAMTLKNNKTKGKVPFVKSIQNGALTGATYMLQAFLGIAFSVIVYVIFDNLYYDAGVLLPLSFGQGPGNAMTWDINFTSAGFFDSNGSFGLSLASIGFIVASVVGVLYINLYRKNGEINPKKEEVATNKIEDYVLENEIPETESCDKFSIQLGLVALGYGFAFLVMLGLGAISDFTNSIAWGFNFIWGVIGATIIKFIINSLHKKGVIKRQYISNYSMDRISGFAFDLMIVAGVASIEIKDISNYIWPIVILSIIGTICTTVFVRIISHKVFPEYEHESFAVNFGTLTGTASNGMILLKEIDPNFETPMSDIFTVSQLPAMIFVAPLLLLLNFSSKSFGNCLIAMGIFFVLFVLYTIFLIISSKKQKSK